MHDPHGPIQSNPTDEVQQSLGDFDPQIRVSGKNLHPLFWAMCALRLSRGSHFRRQKLLNLASEEGRAFLQSEAIQNCFTQVFLHGFDVVISRKQHWHFHLAAASRLVEACVAFL